MSWKIVLNAALGASKKMLCACLLEVGKLVFRRHVVQDLLSITYLLYFCSRIDCLPVHMMHLLCATTRGRLQLNVLEYVNLENLAAERGCISERGS